MNLGLASKVAFVAGGSQGLGLGIAQELVREGAKVFLGSRNESSLQEAKERLTADCSERLNEIQFGVLDTSNPDSIDDWVRQGLTVFEGIDLLVVNTGGPKPGNFEDISLDEWKDAGEQLLFGAVYLLKRCLPTLKQSAAPSILFVTSTSVRQPIESLILSNVYRPAVAALAKSLSVELAPLGIRVNTLMPGRISTQRVRSLDLARSEQRNLSIEEVRNDFEKLIPLGRYGDPEEFGRVATFLLSPAASYLNGVTFPVDGGMLKSL